MKTAGGKSIIKKKQHSINNNKEEILYIMFDLL